MNQLSLYKTLKAKNFFSDCWESDQLQFFKSSEIDLSQLVSFDDLMAALSQTFLDPRFVCLFKDGVACPPEKLKSFSLAHYSGEESLISFQQLKHCINNEGYSLKIFGVDRYLPKVMEFSRKLATDFKHQISLNCYYTPGNESFCFPPHTDGYNILILQLKGQKKWNVAQRNPDPAKRKEKIEKEDLKKEFIIREGESFFLPAGTPHCAQTLEEDSFHLTIGFHPVTTAHYIKYLSQTKKDFGKNVYDISKEKFVFDTNIHEELFDQEMLTDFIATSFYSNTAQNPKKKSQLPQPLGRKQIFRVAGNKMFKTILKKEKLIVWAGAEKICISKYFNEFQSVLKEGSFSMESLSDLGIPEVYGFGIVNKLFDAQVITAV